MAWTRYKILTILIMFFSMLNVNGQNNKLAIVDSIGEMDSMNQKGLWLYYYKNHKLAKTAFYENGMLNGPLTNYTFKGEIYKITSYKDNKKNGWESLFINGNIERIQYYFEDKVDSMIIDYEKGRLTYTAEVISGNILNGKYTSYYKNGRINSISIYSYDYFKYFIEMYYKNGEIKYLRDCSDPDNCKFIYYKKNGEIMKTLFSPFTSNKQTQ